MDNKKDIFHNLFVFEMANNHMGNLEHGLRIIRDIHKVCEGFDYKFGFKVQYRHLDTFIHPEFKGRTDIKYVKRFQKTRLTEDQFKTLKDEMSRLGFITICTPFDESSVNLIEQHGFDIIKIGSCSFTDWPLLERIAKTDKPIIVSTAAAPIEDIDRVVSFFTHREKAFCLMHCVAEYPTLNKDLQLNQISFLKSRYPQINIGYSTHEDPDSLDPVKMAVAKGASVFEKHVGIKTNEFRLNDYSATPEQVRGWLKAAQAAFEICGVAGKRYESHEGEKKSLMALRRGVFAKRLIKKAEKISLSDVFLAIPTQEGQITANDMSKYTELHAKKDVEVNKPILFSDTWKEDNRDKIYSIVSQVKEVLKRSNVLVPNRLDFEISHHYGIDRFKEYGTTIINFINRAYCKKLIILISGQKHPEQYHKIKEETFHILYGDVKLILDGVEKELNPGDIVTIEKGARHIFSSKNGAVIEEISSTHNSDDSYYTEPEIARNKGRKTLVTYWAD